MIFLAPKPRSLEILVHSSLGGALKAVILPPHSACTPAPSSAQGNQSPEEVAALPEEDGLTVRWCAHNERRKEGGKEGERKEEKGGDGREREEMGRSEEGRERKEGHRPAGPQKTWSRAWSGQIPDTGQGSRSHLALNLVSLRHFLAVVVGTYLSLLHRPRL